MEDKMTMEQKITQIQEVIKNLRVTYNEVNQRKVETYHNHIEKIQPIINFMKTGRYYFSHPDFSEISTIGPILGKNTHDNLLYVYDLDSGMVKEINMLNTSKEPKVIWLDNYFVENDFEVAMKGLIHLNDFPERVISGLQEQIDKDNSLIEKYTLNENL